MAEPVDDLYVGKRTLEERLVREDQLLECLFELAEEAKAREGQMGPRPLGALLVSRGYLGQADFTRILSERQSASGSPGQASSSVDDAEQLIAALQNSEEWTSQRLKADRGLGEAIVTCGFSTQAQVDECLQVQRTAKSSGGPLRRLGEIMVEKRYLAAKQLQQALAYTGKTVQVCEKCGRRYNILHARPGKKYTCKSCGGFLIPASPTEPHVDDSIYGLEAVSASVHPAVVSAPPSAPLVDPAEVDRAVFLYLRQKNMVQRDALRQAVQFQEGVARYGIDVPLLEVLRRRKILNWQEDQSVGTVKFAQVVRSDAWRQQSVPGYRITGKVAKGGFATIFRAESLFAGQRVALKLLHTDRAKDPRTVDRFRREALLMISMDHPHIVKAYEHDVYRGIPYFTMELVEGGSLEDATRELGGLEPRDALQVTRQVAEALFYMQQEGYIHRDMKPENILLDRKGTAKVCDLGFATLIRQRAEGHSEVTVGTVGYVSPEQARGELDLKVGTDIYSLGLTLYFVLTAVQPFEGGDSERIMAERFAGGVAAPEFERVRAPASLLQVLKKMLHPDRIVRYRTYPELLEALDGVRI